MFKFANDKWNSRQGFIIAYDKLEHFLGSFVLAYFLSLWVNPLLSAMTTFTLGFLWEIKDAFYPYEVYGILGGDGFSYKDLAADYIGAMLYLCLYLYGLL